MLHVTPLSWIKKYNDVKFTVKQIFKNVSIIIVQIFVANKWWKKNSLPSISFKKKKI